MLENTLNARTVGWLMYPTLFQHLPQTVRELHPSRRMFASHYLQGNDVIGEFVEWEPPTDSFVYDHSERITIRWFRRTTVLEPELVRSDTLRAHPSDRATLGVRAVGQLVCRVGDYGKQTEVHYACVAGLIDQDVVLGDLTQQNRRAILAVENALP